MATEFEDGTIGLSPEEWQHERNCMAGIAILDLEDMIACRNSKGQPRVPTIKDVARAFSLLASGLEWSEEEVAPHRAAFEQGLTEDETSRTAILREAMERLTDEIGYTPMHPIAGVVLATFTLKGETSH